MWSRLFANVAFGAVATFAVSACAGSPSPLIATPAAGAAVGTAPNLANAASPIKHVIVIVQENRSFDNLFYGFPGADTATVGTLHDGTRVALAPVPLEDGKDIGHFHYSYNLAYDDAKMDGFDLEQGYAVVDGAYSVVPQTPSYPYAYVPPSETKPYFDLASRYTLADRMFASNSGPSFPAHQYLIAGQSNLADEVPASSPWGCDSPASSLVPQLGGDGRDTAGIYPCFDYRTISDAMEAASRSWRDYAPALTTPAGGTFASPFDAIAHIRNGAGWANVVSPETTVLTDIKSGNLPDLTYVTPSFADSDHPMGNNNRGPSWVASIVNAVGQPVLEFDRDLRDVGRLGRLVRPRHTTATRRDGPGLPRSAHRRLAVRAPWLHFARAARIREHRAFHRIDVRLADARHGRLTRRRFERLLRFYAIAQALHSARDASGRARLPDRTANGRTR